MLVLIVNTLFIQPHHLLLHQLRRQLYKIYAVVIHVSMAALALSIQFIIHLHAIVPRDILALSALFLLLPQLQRLQLQTALVHARATPALKMDCAYQTLNITVIYAFVKITFSAPIVNKPHRPHLLRQ